MKYFIATINLKTFGGGLNNENTLSLSGAKKLYVNKCCV
jgi:hypothetical protein